MFSTYYRDLKFKSRPRLYLAIRRTTNEGRGRAVVVAQLVECSLPIPESAVRIQSSANFILNIFCQLC